MSMFCLKGLVSFGIFTTSIVNSSNAFSFQAECKYLPTYFQYCSSDIQELCQKDFVETMSNEELLKWDEITADIVQKNPKAERSRMYAYLYTAQKEAAFLSYNSHGYFVGSIAPISTKILQLFFPSVPNVDSDEYSELLAQIVFAKLKERYDEEMKQIRDFPIEENDPKLKEFPKPYLGIKSASNMPWILKDPTQFLAEKPPLQNDPYWVQQAEVVKNISENATDQQKDSAKFWAGESAPNSGNLMMIANEYMFGNDLPFSKIVCVRSVIAQAGIDVDIALFNAKYTYLIKRPSAINTSIHPLIYLPTHPSYPSGHSTWAPACATILSYYFPESRECWFELANACGESRIFGGIHYPIDHQQGWELGIQLGNAIIQSLCY